MCVWLLVTVTALAKAHEVSTVGGPTLSKRGSLDKLEGILSPWTYADDSMCLQTYVNYLALWAFRKMSSVETGVATGIMRHNTTCSKLGYTDETHDLDEEPKFVRVLSAGVTAWKQPHHAANVLSSIAGKLEPVPTASDVHV